MLPPPPSPPLLHTDAANPHLYVTSATAIWLLYAMVQTGTLDLGGLTVCGGLDALLRLAATAHQWGPPGKEGQNCMQG